MKPKKITRTDRDELKLHSLAFLGGSGAAIVHQEARGQKELVASAQLPANGLMGDSAGAQALRQALENAGGKVLQPTPGDPLFVDVQLPPGWSKKASDHAMWSTLVDAQGRKRASIFYKAAFHDRDAHISTVSRLQAGAECEDYDDNPKRYCPVISAGDCVLWRGAMQTAWTNVEMKAAYAKARADQVPHSEFPKDADERCREIAQALLTKTFPAQADCLAYWDQSDDALRQLLPASESQPITGEVYTVGLTVYKQETVDRRAPDLEDGFACYNSINGRRYEFYGKKTVIQAREVVDWSTATWKTKVFSSDAAAMEWMKDRLPSLVSQRGCRIEATLHCGERLIESRTIRP